MSGMYRLLLNAVLGMVVFSVLAFSAAGSASAAVAVPERGAPLKPPAERSVAAPIRPTPSKRPPARPAPKATIATAPERRYLTGINHEFQDLNNCGPVTTNMVLSYYGVDLSQDYTANKLRPNPRDVSVGAIEMVTFAQLEYDFAGEVSWGGNMKLLESFIANGVPVIALQPLTPTSDVNHFRLVHGYDRAERTVTVSDSYLGRNLVWSYEYFEGLWEQRGYSYSLIYPRKQQATVTAITEKYRANDEARRAASLERVERLVERRPDDPWAWLQLGQTLYRRERYQESLAAWERANELGLPEKAVWYAPWPAQLMNDLGRYSEARELASAVLAKNPGSSEMYYERARAAQEMGDFAAVRSDLASAVSYAPYHPKFRLGQSEFDRIGRFSPTQRPGW